MTKDAVYTETMTRIYRDSNTLNQLGRKNPLQLLWMARGCEVLRECGYDPIPQAGSCFWQMDGPGGGVSVYPEVFDAHGNLPKIGHKIENQLPEMHCWLFERQTNCLIDFGIELLKTKAERAFGPGHEHPIATDFLWQPVNTICGIGYQPSELAASIAARVWAKLVTGPLRLMLQCDCGRVQRLGSWSNGLPSPNSVPWRGPRAWAVCPSCRTRGVAA